MNSRYVEAAADVLSDELPDRFPASEQATNLADLLITVLIRELRSDPGAVDALCSVWLPHMKMGDICKAQLAALCDYLEKPDA